MGTERQTPTPGEDTTDQTRPGQAMPSQAKPAPYHPPTQGTEGVSHNGCQLMPRIQPEPGIGPSH